MKSPFWTHRMYSAGELLCYLVLTNVVWFVWEILKP